MESMSVSLNSKSCPVPILFFPFDDREDCKNRLTMIDGQKYCDTCLFIHIKITIDIIDISTDTRPFASYSCNPVFMKIVFLHYKTFFL